MDARTWSATGRRARIPRASQRDCGQGRSSARQDSLKKPGPARSICNPVVINSPRVPRPVNWIGDMPSKAAHRRARTNLDDPTLYINRELSHLEFQRRVLEEARDSGHPLLERVKFLSILGSNLNEFFMVRVAGLMQQIENGVHEVGLDGRSPTETLHAVGLAVR